ncbi:tetratricopeptide repeat protein [Salidesulfovibrio onnuriiensis]|uniref:tetratricopeptide repeat protein n=1 Tax=Salidesulfovibrio onnuriiensis TaxID=2583823 RepID=UPI0011CA1803|nr:tetratricopeptide repeat protein [Salidesulfovibrio onnuriiensis]
MGKKYVVMLLAMLAFIVCCGCAARKQGRDAAPDLAKADTDAVRAYRSGDVGKSLALFRELVAADPENPVYLNNMGVLLLESGQAKEALEAFESASMRAPGNADYLINIGFAHIRLGSYDEALVFFNRALQVAPARARGYYGKGIASLELEESELAMGCFRQAAALDPSDGESLFMKAYAAQKNGLWQDAAEGYSAYLVLGEASRQQANAYSNRALCLFQLGRFKQGMVDLQKAMELDDSVSVFYYNRALGYERQQQLEAAVDDYTRAISRKPDFPEAYINRGELHFLLGNAAKGCSDLRRACSMGFCEAEERYKAAGKCE